MATFKVTVADRDAGYVREQLDKLECNPLLWEETAEPDDETDPNIRPPDFFD